jgi:hypothetical protein
MNTTVIALWFTGLLLITFFAGCSLGIGYSRKKGTPCSQTSPRSSDPSGSA